MTRVWMKKREGGVHFTENKMCLFNIEHKIYTKQYTNHLLPRRSLVVRGMVGEGLEEASERRMGSGGGGGCVSC